MSVVARPTTFDRAILLISPLVSAPKAASPPAVIVRVPAAASPSVTWAVRSASTSEYSRSNPVSANAVAVASIPRISAAGLPLILSEIKVAGVRIDTLISRSDVALIASDWAPAVVASRSPVPATIVAPSATVTSAEAVPSLIAMAARANSALTSISTFASAVICTAEPLIDALSPMVTSASDVRSNPARPST